MSMRDKHGVYWVTALVLAVALAMGFLHGCKREKAEPNKPASPNEATTAEATKPPVDPIQAAANLFREPKPSLQAIIDASKQKWDTVFREWWGKPAPDFTLADLDGTPHKLSDYRGKDVILVFWATWCGPCKLEVPHLKELREAYPKDKLAILAVSKEAPALVKGFVAEQQINYTVLLNPGDLPEPYSKVEFIPSSFYIDPEGNFKLAVRGIVPSSDAKAILQAQ